MAHGRAGEVWRATGELIALRKEAAAKVSHDTVPVVAQNVKGRGHQIAGRSKVGHRTRKENAQNLQ